MVNRLIRIALALSALGFTLAGSASGSTSVLLACLGVSTILMIGALAWGRLGPTPPHSRSAIEPGDEICQDGPLEP